MPFLWRAQENSALKERDVCVQRDLPCPSPALMVIGQSQKTRRGDSTGMELLAAQTSQGQRALLRDPWILWSTAGCPSSPGTARRSCRNSQPGGAAHAGSESGLLWANPAGQEGFAALPGAFQDHSCHCRQLPASPGSPSGAAAAAGTGSAPSASCAPSLAKAIHANDLCLAWGFLL